MPEHPTTELRVLPQALRVIMVLVGLEVLVVAAKAAGATLLEAPVVMQMLPQRVVVAVRGQAQIVVAVVVAAVAEAVVLVVGQQVTPELQPHHPHSTVNR